MIPHPNWAVTWVPRDWKKWLTSFECVTNVQPHIILGPHAPLIGSRNIWYSGNSARGQSSSNDGMPYAICSLAIYIEYLNVMHHFLFVFILHIWQVLFALQAMYKIMHVVGLLSSDLSYWREKGILVSMFCLAALELEWDLAEVVDGLQPCSCEDGWTNELKSVAVETSQTTGSVDFALQEE